MSENRGKRLDFKFVDGLRAIAAIAVALFHAYLFTGHNGDTANDLPAIFKVFGLGDFAVPLFIVLSGFVLMIPVAGSRRLEIRHGTWGYIKRRAKRILPPYYISLALFAALIFLVQILNREQDTAWDSKIPVTIGGAISHILVVQNLSPDWIYQINGPAWSVATEWQLYFALPFLLLPIWRRFGQVAALAAALVVGTGLSLVPGFEGAHFWFLGLFAMGGLAARAVAKGTAIPRIGLITIAAWLVAAVVIGVAHPKQIISETLLGAAISLMLVWLSGHKAAGTTTPLLKVLESRFLVWMGLWSYSLYLIHSPILALGNLLLLDVDMPTAARFAIEIGVVLPVAAALAYVFHVLVERRFMTSHQQSVKASDTKIAGARHASEPVGQPSNR